MATGEAGGVPRELRERAAELAEEVIELQRETFAMGRARGRAEAFAEVTVAIERSIEETVRMLASLTPAQIDVFEETYGDAPPTAIVAAYFGAAASSLRRLLSDVRALSTEDP